MSNVKAYIGMDYGGEEWTLDEAITVIAEELSKEGIKGMTVIPALGMWQGEIERSLVVDLLDVDEGAAGKALQSICNELLQYEVIYVANGITYHIQGANVEQRRAAME